MDILSLFVVIPVVTMIALMFVNDYKLTRVVSAFGAGVQLLLSIYLVFAFYAERAAGDTSQMLFRKSYMWFEHFNFKYEVGVDGISVAMLLLTSIILFAGVFASWQMKDLSKEFFISLILLATGVFGFFITIDLFAMFVFYEVAVIPMYLLIGIWGTGKKEYSAMKLTLMLMGGSAVLIVGLLGIYFNSAPDGGHLTFNLLELGKINMPFAAQKFFFPFVFVGFGVLGALFPFHTWSPDGHASAPTAVSMLHAGVLMKLGGYGIFRVAMALMPEGANYWAWIFIILSGASVLYGALGAIKQTDLKYINAYSSVSHVGMITFALLMMNQTAFTGAIMQMISHGLITALFFSLIGMIYGRTHTREIYKMGGLMKILPFLSVAYVIAGLASLGLPGFSGFIAEMTIFVGAFQHPDLFHRVFTVIAVSSIVVTAVFILRVVGIMLLGPLKHKEHADLPPAAWYEKVATGLLIIAITGIGVAPLWLSNLITDSLPPVVEKFLSLN